MGALDRVFRSRRPSQERPLAAIIAGLWRNGEQGVWYDVEGFRDSWNSVGTNFLVNGGFDTANGWIVGTGWTISDGIATFNNTSGATQSINRSAPSATGKWYLIEFDLGISNGSVDVAYGGSSAVRFSVSGRCRFLHYRINNYGLYFYALNGAVGSIDNITIKEWFGLSSCALYQDATGALPVYMPGQGQVDPPVGLLLDKRKGLVRGPELLVNGDFSAGATSWGVSGADATHIATFSNGALRYQSDTTSPVLNISQVGVPIVAGKWYEVTVAVSSWTSGGLKTDTLNGNSAAGLTLTQGPGTYRVIGLATATTSSFGFSRNSTNVDLTIDSISVRELLGNHAYQTTTTSRPTLSARYNLLTSSENLASTWSVFNGSFSAVGGYWKFTENASGSLHSFLQTPSQPKAASYRASFVGKPAGRSVVRFVLNAYSGNFAEVRFNLATGVVVGVFSGGDGVIESYSIEPAEDGAYRCTIVGKPSAAAAGAAFDVSLGMMDGMSSSYTGDGVSGILVNYFDCRSVNDGVGLPPYQRVVDANTYDTAGFPLYLRFDGVDDSLLTADIDFSTVSRAIAVSAIRKLSDASRGIVFELGGTGYSSPGSFNQEIMWFSANVSTSYSGATGNTTSTYSCIAPFSAVMSSAWNLSAPLQTFRVNEVLRSTSTVAVGGGMFQKAPLFIGRRNNASVPFNGRLYGLIVRSGATPDATMARIERHLNSKARAY